MPAELVVWSAGIRAPEFLKDLDGLESNQLNQLKVPLALADDVVRMMFLLSATVPNALAGHPFGAARAQAAHEQATHMGRPMVRCLRGLHEELGGTETGARLSRSGEYSAVGNLMGRLVGGSYFFIEDHRRAFMYNALYRDTA